MVFHIRPDPDKSGKKVFKSGRNPAGYPVTGYPVTGTGYAIIRTGIIKWTYQLHHPNHPGAAYLPHAWVRHHRNRLEEALVRRGRHLQHPPLHLLHLSFTLWSPGSARVYIVLIADAGYPGDHHRLHHAGTAREPISKHVVRSNN